MTWHLKDRELEKKLIAIDSEFTKELNKKCDWIEKDHGNFLPKHIPFSFDIHKEEIRLFFTTSDVEKRPNYNPNDWNSYPSVTPPEGILMRVETVCGFSTYLECAIFEDGIWKSERNGKADDELYGKVKRFRPWED